ncbi:MAG TPA: fasciclin domain-containing protein [Methylomirabilota bacterium]|nr:fasciclin domain-containing protein [Methylomirabilota bacterium]
MKSIHTLTLSAIVAASSFLGVAHADTKAPSKDIVALASGNGSFKTLVAAVRATGVVATLHCPGPFTVVASTDEAFGKLFKGTAEDLSEPENKAKLVSILTYHVVTGKVMAADVKTMKAQTLSGQSLDAKVTGGTLTVDNARGVKTDVPASNGVTDVIDTVVLSD